MDSHDLSERIPNRAVLTVVGFTVVLTAAFIGAVALLSGDSRGVGDRLPFYVLALSVAFLLALWQLDDRARDGLTVLVAASGIAVGAAALFSLAVEGAAHAAAHPFQVFDAQFVVYFLAAAIICTGLGVWGFHHWREFTRTHIVE